MKNDQLCFAGGFVSEAEIIRNHYKRLGKKGGSVSTPRKRAASAISIRKALAARAAQIEQQKAEKAVARLCHCGKRFVSVDQTSCPECVGMMI